MFQLGFDRESGPRRASVDVTDMGGRVVAVEGLEGAVVVAGTVSSDLGTKNERFRSSSRIRALTFPSAVGRAGAGVEDVAGRVGDVSVVDVGVRIACILLLAIRSKVSRGLDRKQFIRIVEINITNFFFATENTNSARIATRNAIILSLNMKINSAPTSMAK